MFLEMVLQAHHQHAHHATGTSIKTTNSEVYNLTETDWKDFQEDYQRRFDNRLPPESLRPWLRYARNHQCSERELYHAIDTDIQVFRDIIIEQQQQPFRQDEVISHGIQQTNFYMGLHLENHTWTVVASADYHKKGDPALRTIQQQLVWLLEPVRAHMPPLNATYFFNLHDGSRNSNSTRPIFSASKQAYWTDGVSIPLKQQVTQQQVQEPDAIFDDLYNGVFPDQRHELHNYRTFNHQIIDNDFMDPGVRDVLVPFYHNLPPRKQTSLTSPSLPFQQRHNTIVWRGSTTGPWGFGPRFQLVQRFGGNGVHPIVSSMSSSNTTAIAANDYSDDGSDDTINVDFGFTKMVQAKHKTMAPNMRMADHLTYPQMQSNKYIMDVDGNSFTERFPTLLGSGSLIFKSSRYREWYTERLVPYQDYIPVNYNQSDLFAKVEWAHHQHPSLLAEITEHARRTTNKYLRKEDLRCYVYRLMMEYQTLFEE